MILSVLPFFSCSPPRHRRPRSRLRSHEAPAAEPKMICKYEQVTGSRLQKTKVCRPEGQEGNDQSTALQRSLDKLDARPIQAPGLGN
jgi:hypothetical protein